MKTDTITRGIALVAGAICAACALAILLEGVVLGGEPMALKHWLTIGIVSVAMMSGHLVTEAIRIGRYLGAIGFAIIFIAATGLVVYKSTGRQAETTYASEADAATLAKALADKGADLEAARQRKAEAEAQVDWEIQGRPDKRGRQTTKPGCGRNCEDWKKRATEVQAHIEKIEREIAELGPQKPAVPEAQNFADLAAAFGADEDKVKAAAVLAVPFLQTVLFEFGAIWCFGFAFRPVARRDAASRASDELPPETPETVPATVDQAAIRATVANDQDEIDAGKPGNPGNGGNRVLSRAEALLDLTRRLASGETVPSQETLADAWGVHPGTASKWLKGWRREGLAPTAQRIGRCNRIKADA